MKKLLIAGMLLFILHIVAACNQKESAYEQNPNLHVSKSVNLYVSKPEAQGYTVYKKIEDDETVKTIQTVNIDPTVSYEPVTFAIWLSPKTDILEVIIEGQSEYGKNYIGRR